MPNILLGIVLSTCCWELFCDQFVGTCFVENPGNEFKQSFYGNGVAIQVWGMPMKRCAWQLVKKMLLEESSLINVVGNANGIMLMGVVC